MTAAEAVDRWDALSADWPDGRIKLALMRRLLALRRAHADLFDHGSYQELTVTGPDREHIVAFTRTHRDTSVVVVAGRHFHGVTDGGRHWPQFSRWDAAVKLLVRKGFHDLLEERTVVPTAGKTKAADLFRSLPVAVLVSS
jgi:(1->4)-alpha-D-glucan 1-alpha-D-glucosylmutase